MAPIECALEQMLLGALLAYAQLREFRLGEGAARFLAKNAVYNIQKVCKTDFEKYAATVGAIASIPALAMRIEAQTHVRDFPDESSIRHLMETCSGPWPICGSAQ